MTSLDLMQNLNDAQRNQVYYYLWENQGRPQEESFGERTFHNNATREAERSAAIVRCDFFKNMIYFHLWVLRGSPQGVSASFGQELFNDPHRCSEPERSEATKRAWRDYAEECSICSDSLISKARTSAQSCNHIFHRQCLTAWLGRDDSCPLCRRVVTYVT